MTTVLVTGAGGALGQAVVGRLRAAGFSVRLAAPQLAEDLRLVEHARVSHVGDEEDEEVDARPLEVSPPSSTRLAG